MTKQREAVFIVHGQNVFQRLSDSEKARVANEVPSGSSLVWNNGAKQIIAAAESSYLWQNLPAEERARAVRTDGNLEVREDSTNDWPFKYFHVDLAKPLDRLNIEVLPETWVADAGTQNSDTISPYFNVISRSTDYSPELFRSLLSRVDLNQAKRFEVFRPRSNWATLDTPSDFESWLKASDKTIVGISVVMPEGVLSYRKMSSLRQFSKGLAQVFKARDGFGPQISFMSEHVDAKELRSILKVLGRPQDVIDRVVEIANDSPVPEGPMFPSNGLGLTNTL